MSILEVQKQFGIPDSEIKIFFDPLISKGFILLDTSNNLSITGYRNNWKIMDYY